MNLMEKGRRIEMTKDALLGQAAGDAFGVPVEFLSRSEVRAFNLREMSGADSGRLFGSQWGDRIPKGSWSDDTSMTVASMSSFILYRGKIDYQDQMTQFVRWWEEDEYCCLSRPFGLGGNVSEAMDRFRNGAPALECGGKGIMANGNGALMRILPFALYCIFNRLNMEDTVTITGNGSAITHAHEISRMCCFLWTEFLRSLAESAGIVGAIRHIETLPYRTWFSEETAGALEFITERKIRVLTEKDIGETGYVADTLYAALYSLYHADNYEMSIRNAVNLGYDTDTAGAVTGTAAGILYGRSAIPENWMKSLRKREYLESVAENFAKCFNREERGTQEVS